VENVNPKTRLRLKATEAIKKTSNSSTRTPKRNYEVVTSRAQRTEKRQQKSRANPLDISNPIQHSNQSSRDRERNLHSKSTNSGNHNKSEESDRLNIPEAVPYDKNQLFQKNLIFQEHTTENKVPENLEERRGK
jgi:hypothetical protein